MKDHAIFIYLQLIINNTIFSSKKSMSGYRYILIFLLLALVNSSQQISQRFIQQQSLAAVEDTPQQNIREQIEQWNKTNSLITFQQTIKAFPELKQNMDGQNLAKLIQSGGCSNGLQLARYAFIDNQVYRYSYFPLPSTYQDERVESLKKFFQMLTYQTSIPDLYLAVHYQDQLIPQTIPEKNFQVCDKLPLFLFNKNGSSILEKKKFLLPDPLIANITWLQEVDSIKNISKKYQWKNKDERMIFRGLASGPHYHDMKLDENYDFFKYFHRGAYVLLSLKYPKIVDARFTRLKTPLYQQTARRAHQDVFVQKMTMEEHLKYKFILSADGFGAAWKRVPFVLFSNSLLIKPSSQKIQWFYDKIIPGTHFIQIKSDISDIFSKWVKFKQNNEKSEEIIKNANKIASQHLQLQSIMKFTIETLKKYSNIQNLNLTKKQKQLVKRGQDIQDILIWRSNKIYLVIIEVAFLLASILIVLISYKKKCKSQKIQKKQEKQHEQLKTLHENQID